MKEKINDISSLYHNSDNDFLLLDNKYSLEGLCKELDNLHFERMKCYVMTDCSDQELVRYFHLIYKSTEEFHVYERKS